MLLFDFLARVFTAAPVAVPSAPALDARSPRFRRAVRFVLDHEAVFLKGHWGDYQYAITENVSGDAGGLTKYGIDQRSHPSTDIAKLTQAQAEEIYFYKYWLPSLAEGMPLGWGEVLFDIKVNGGDGPRMLQRALNDECGYALTTDGRLGPITVAAMKASGRWGLKAFLTARQERYNALAQKPSRAKFLKGWTARNDDLTKFVLPLISA